MARKHMERCFILVKCKLGVRGPGHSPRMAATAGSAGLVGGSERAGSEPVHGSGGGNWRLHCAPRDPAVPPRASTQTCRARPKRQASVLVAASFIIAGNEITRTSIAYAGTILVGCLHSRLADSSGSRRTCSGPVSPTQEREKSDTQGCTRFASLCTAFTSCLLWGVWPGMGL